MATTTYTNGGTGLQPFGSASGIKFIDNFVTTSFPTQGSVDPQTGVALYLVYQVKVYMGGTSGTSGAARLGLWNSATSYYQVANQTINGVSATSSSATVLEVATLNAVIQSGKSYYAGGWASSSLASKRNNSTGSFSSYTGNGTSGTVGTTYNPGNLYFQILYYYLPTAPASISVTSTTPTTASISWTAPSDDGGTAVTAYKIQYNKDGQGWGTWDEGTYGVTTTSATLTGLRPGSSYQFRVAAKNGVVPGYGINGTDSEAGIYSDTSGDWIYDGYSSGPYVTSSATQLPGGIRNAANTAFTAAYPYICIIGTQTASSMNQGTFTYTASMTLPSVTGITAGDYVIIRDATTSSFNISSVGSYVTSVVGNTVNYVSSYFNSTPTPITGTSATVEVWRTAALKRYNGSTWTTVM